jgi:hypothetical protein
MDPVSSIFEKRKTYLERHSPFPRDTKSKIISKSEK